MNLWVALDWGTTNFRAYLMRGNDVVDKITTQEGMKFIDQQNFENTLVKNIKAWHDNFDFNLIIASGMVGAKQGWIEVPYLNCPCNIQNLNYETINILDNVTVSILSGIAQLEPADVMRGEETQIAGFLLDNENFNGSICLPGTHNKWVSLNRHEIKKFTTFLTGELYEITKKHSILKHSLNSNELNANIVKISAEQIINDPTLITNKLFEIRAENLINNSDDLTNNSKLAGYLLGIELSGSKSYWEGKDLIIIGSSNLNKYYQLILKEKSNSIRLFNSNEMVLKGLSLFKKSLNL